MDKFLEELKYQFKNLHAEVKAIKFLKVGDEDSFCSSNMDPEFNEVVEHSILQAEKHCKEISRIVYEFSNNNREHTNQLVVYACDELVAYTYKLITELNTSTSDKDCDEVLNYLLYCYNRINNYIPVLAKVRKVQ